MGQALYQGYPEAKAIFEEADEALGEKLSTLIFQGPEEALKLTANAQPAILTVSLAAHAVFSRRGPAADFMAGHSLGEYSALVAAQALSLAEAVRSVRARGQFMQQAVPAGIGAMAAVIGLGADQVKAVCEASAEGQVLSPANYNDPTQTVIAGHAQAVERATPRLKEAGARRVMLLPVSAPFHCALMEPVKPRLQEVLAKVTFRAPAVPVVTNVEAKPNVDPARTLSLLITQVTGSVRWVECVEELARQGVTRVYELGPGSALSGMVKRIAKELSCANVEDEKSLKGAL
jgi:[acyl-carrier-protein] S-malonyltransferase